jgi:hypothetical protein
MKKSFAIAIIAIFGAIILATSCTKSNATGNYTCTCVLTTPFSLTNDTITFPFQDVTQGAATTNCNEAQTTYTLAGQSTASCKL